MRKYSRFVIEEILKRISNQTPKEKSEILKTLIPDYKQVVNKYSEALKQNISKRTAKKRDDQYAEYKEEAEMIEMLADAGGNERQ